ncbi:hypothetical protein AAG906_035205 [Vitis piasezkii]
MSLEGTRASFDSVKDLQLLLLLIVVILHVHHIKPCYSFAIRGNLHADLNGTAVYACNVFVLVGCFLIVCQSCLIWVIGFMLCSTKGPAVGFKHRVNLIDANASQAGP